MIFYFLVCYLNFGLPHCIALLFLFMYVRESGAWDIPLNMGGLYKERLVHSSL